MITRLKIKGFKNLRDVDLEFGSFTCIAGVNAVGKSNLFDAIKFLSALATEKLVEAAKAVRSEGQKASELRDIFYKSKNQYVDDIKFEVDLIIPLYADDDLGETAKASITSVKYILELRLEQEESIDYISIVREELLPINQQSAKKSLKSRTSPDWRKQAIHGKRSSPFISTDKSKDPIVVRLHQDQEKGKPFDRNPKKMGRTVLSTVSAEFPTAFVVKEELRSWTLLQLEPTSLRKSDDMELMRNARIASDGSLLAATLYRLRKEFENRDFYQEITNRLLDLIEDVKELWVEKDEKRQLLTLVLKTKDGSEIPARGLSDGTLRFLALTILESDPRSGGVICLEEPENGIHPKKIKDIIQLLQDISFDPSIPADNSDNPIRQVFINTHSPLVVQQIPEDCLLIAESEELFDQNTKKHLVQTSFRHLSKTWRDESDASSSVNGIGKLLGYLGESAGLGALWDAIRDSKTKVRRVIDREDIKQGVLFVDE
jgi:predicted ATPase